MVELTCPLRDELQSSRLDTFGTILRENWSLKKAMAEGMSNVMSDTAYDAAHSAGATGGKLIGAGRVLLFCAHENAHSAIEKALSTMRRVPYSFDNVAKPHRFRRVIVRIKQYARGERRTRATKILRPIFC
jgi:D-glycero-alpha-D-manno-heptose-7-phosphate kinase